MSVEDWAEIRRLHRSEGMPIKAIARVLGLGRNTVRRALAAEGPPKYRRSARGSKVDAVEPQVRELLRAYPRMPATVIAERIGWQHGITILKDRVRELRPLFSTAGPVGAHAVRGWRACSVRLVVPAGGHPIGLWPGGASSSVGDRGWILAGDHGDDAAEPAVVGLVVRTLGTVALLGCGSASIGVGQRVRGWQVAIRQA